MDAGPGLAYKPHPLWRWNFNMRVIIGLAVLAAFSASASLAQEKPAVAPPAKPAATAAPAAPTGGAKTEPPPAAPGLKPGDYACVAGPSFKVTGPGAYSSPDGSNPGTFTVTGGTITFTGGILNG